MEMNKSAETLAQIESKNHLYVAHFIPGRMEGWGIGAINEGRQVAPGEEAAFAQNVVDSILPVYVEDIIYSGCTDGRFRLRLADGTPVPNRQKITGADTVMAFAVAETLGDNFYSNPNAPVGERMEEVVDYLSQYGLRPSTHNLCGAAKGFPAIIQNAIIFSKVDGYIERQKLLLPEDVYSQSEHDEIIAGYGERLARGNYKGWNPDIVTDAVARVGGKRALIELRTDERGVSGHVERLITRLDTPNVSIEVNTLAEKSGGDQVFVSNDDRLRKIAELFGRGIDRDYRVASMATEDFTDAAHGTLATGLPTLVVKLAQAA